MSSRVLEVDIVLALEAGADDYIVKPFRLAELGARVNALLRRITRAVVPSNLLCAGEYVLNPANRTVSLRGRPLDLTGKEFDLALLFFSNIGRPLSREAVCVSIWGRGLDVASRTLDTHIYRLRQKLSLSPDNGMRLRAMYSNGYRLDLVGEWVEIPEPVT